MSKLPILTVYSDKTIFHANEIDALAALAAAVCEYAKKFPKGNKTVEDTLQLIYSTIQRSHAVKQH